MYTVSPSLPGVGASEVPGDADFFFFFFTPKRSLYLLLKLPLSPHLCQAVRGW